MDYSTGGGLDTQAGFGLSVSYTETKAYTNDVSNFTGPGFSEGVSASVPGEIVSGGVAVIQGLDKEGEEVMWVGTSKSIGTGFGVGAPIGAQVLYSDTKEVGRVNVWDILGID